MKKLQWLVLLLIMMLFLPATLLARDISPVVSTDWLEQNLANSRLKVIDIRKVEEYKEGHVPGGINVFYGTWAVKREGLDNELPADDDLLDIINAAGLTSDSLIVVVGKVDNTAEQVNNTRVAWTLKYAGFDNIAILDGGYNKWLADKKPVSTEPVTPKSISCETKLRKQLFAGKEYVLKKLGKNVLLDTRMPDFFFGITKLQTPPVERAGHIKGAVNLPSAWIFTKEGAFKPAEELKAMAEGVVGKNKAKEIITYCDTGRLASGWWFVLGEVLGYGDVKLYDGSSQEFGKDPKVPMVKYSWK